VCGVCLFQGVPKGRGKRSKLLLTDNTKISIRPVKAIIIDVFCRRERGSSSDIIMVYGFLCPYTFVILLLYLCNMYMYGTAVRVRELADIVFTIKISCKIFTFFCYMNENIRAIQYLFVHIVSHV
jgi:hypothetical protein